MRLAYCTAKLSDRQKAVLAKFVCTVLHSTRLLFAMAAGSVVLGSAANVDDLFGVVNSACATCKLGQGDVIGCTLVCDGVAYLLPVRQLALLCHEVCTRVAFAPCKESRAQLVNLASALVAAWKDPLVAQRAFDAALGIVLVQVHYTPGPVAPNLAKLMQDPAAWLYPTQYEGPTVFVCFVSDSGHVIYVPHLVLRSSALAWVQGILEPHEPAERHEDEQLVTAVLAESVAMHARQSVSGDIRLISGVFALADCLGLQGILQACRASDANLVAGEDELQQQQLLCHLQEVPCITMGALAFALCVLYAILPGCSPWRARRALRVLALHDSVPDTDGELSIAELQALRAMHAFYTAPDGMTMTTDTLMRFAVCLSHAASLLMVQLHMPADGVCTPPDGIFSPHGTYGDCGILALQGRLELKADVACGSADWFNPLATLWDSTEFWRIWQQDCGDLIGIEMPSGWVPGFVRGLGLAIGLENVQAVCTVVPTNNGRSLDCLLVRRKAFVSAQICLAIVAGYGNAQTRLLPDKSIIDMIVVAFAHGAELDRAGVLASGVQLAFFARLCYRRFGTCYIANQPFGYISPDERGVVLRALVYCVTAKQPARTFNLSACVDALLLLQSNVNRKVSLSVLTAKTVGEILLGCSLHCIGQHLCDVTAGLSVVDMLEIQSDDAFAALAAFVYDYCSKSDASDAVACQCIYELAFAFAGANMAKVCKSSRPMVRCAASALSVLDARQRTHDAVRSLCQTTRRDIADALDTSMSVTPEGRLHADCVSSLASPFEAQRATVKNTSAAMVLLLAGSSFVPPLAQAPALAARFTHLAGVAFTAFSGLYGDRPALRQAYARMCSVERVRAIAHALGTCSDEKIARLVDNHVSPS